MPKLPRTLNWGTLLGAAAGGIGGWGIAVPAAHAMASHLGYTLVVGTASASALSTGALATIGLVGMGLTFGGIALGALVGSFIFKAIMPRSDGTISHPPVMQSPGIPRTIEAIAPELEIDSGLPRTFKDRSRSASKER
jgi:hypothetical protein